MSEEQNASAPGRRKDGESYVDGNTRADGSYIIGKNRTPVGSRFAKDDGRKRGRRVKNVKNVVTEWTEELAATIHIKEGDKTARITKRRAVIKRTIDRAIKGGDRAAEMTLRYAELGERREPGLQKDDHAIIAAWLAMRAGGDSDDHDPPDLVDQGDDDPDETADIKL